MSQSGDSGLEALARDLASGEISRRTALRRLAGGALAAAFPLSFLAEAADAACPPSRRCRGRCCPRGSRCRRGRCKCKRGLRKCRRKCVNLKTSERHCGACGNACGSGETCVAGKCQGPQQQTCGNEVIEGTEQCDGNDLGGSTCLDLGFVAGTLACGPNCTFDTSNCVGADCQSSDECPGEDTECQTRTCVNGVCGFDFAETGVALSVQTAGDCQKVVCDGAGGTMSVTDNLDLPDDNNDCTENLCVNGTASNPAAPAGTACAQGGGNVCDGNGQCVECLVDGDCTSRPICTVGNCTGNFCAYDLVPVGMDPFGDCIQPLVCDGAGACALITPP